MADLSHEYGISKSTVTVWINKAKAIIVDKDKTITTAEYQQILKRWQGLNTLPIFPYNIVQKT